MNRFAISIGLLASSAAMLIAAPFARAEDTVPVSRFEQQVTQSLTLAAAQAGIDADTYALSVVRDRTGPQLFATEALGPRRDRLASNIDVGYVYFDSGIGLRMPLLGSHASQQALEISADAQRRAAQFDYAIAQNDLIAKVRQNYVAYFSARRSERTARAMLEQLRGDDAATGALRRNGFWTKADELQYADLIAKATADQTRAQAQQREALDELGLLTNAVVAPFEAVNPEYASCEPVAQFAVASSYKADPQLQKLAAQRNALVQLLPLQRWAGMDASLSVSLHGFYKVTGRTGYLGLMALDVAMPLRGMHESSDEARRVSAQIRQANLLIAARRHELQTGIAVALATRGEAKTMLAQAQFDRKTLAEDLRETQVRFANVTPDSLTEVHHKLQLAYQSQLAIIADEDSLLQSTARVLQFAPDACTSVSAMNAPQKGRETTP